MHNRILKQAKFIFIPCLENNWRPELLSGKFLVYYFIFLLVLKIFTLPLFFSLQQNIFFADITKATIIELVNAERKTMGMLTLKENTVLDKAAMLKAQDMLAKDYFSHQGPEGIPPWQWFKLAGYKYNLAGENLAIGFMDSEEVYQAWMNSPSHKANILNQSFQEIGVAVLQGDFNGNNTTIVVNLFAKPLAKATTSQPFLKNEPQTTPVPSELVVVKTTAANEPIKIVRGEVSKKEEAQITFNFLSFISAHYYDLIQKIIYLSLIFIIIALLINIFVRIDIQHPDLILKTLGFIAILAAFSAIDKITLINLIPHQLIIS